MQDAPAIIAEIALSDEEETRSLAAKLAPMLSSGDVVALGGDLGSGKTAFARALINALPGDEEEVPSPTFTLVQTYERGDIDVYHFDLYRLEDPEEAFELGIEDAFADGLSLIEWPDHLGGYLPRRHLSVNLSLGTTPSLRHAVISGGDTWPSRLATIFDAERAHG